MELEDDVVLIKTEKPVKTESMRLTRSRSAAFLYANGSALQPILVDSEAASINTEIKSEVVMRAKAAEARVAALEAAIAEKSDVLSWTKRCFECEAKADSESVVLKKRLMKKEKDLAAKDRQLKALRNFRQIRSEMKSNIHKVQQEMNEKYARANTLDLVIVMDCTESMSPWIQAAKTSITSIINNVKKDHANATVNTWALWVIVIFSMASSACKSSR